MKNLRTQLKIVLTMAFVLAFFTFTHNARAADFYWYSTGNTTWASSTNWYSDVDHTVSAGSVPTANDNVYLLGAVAPIFDVDSDLYGTLLPVQIDATGLTGGAYTSGIIFEGAYGYTTSFNTTIYGNATFNGFNSNASAIYGNVTFNDFTYNSNYVASATFNNFSHNESTIGGNAIFNDNSYNANYVAGSGTFYGTSYNYFNSIEGDVTFNDNSYDYFGAYGGNVFFNNTNQPFIFSNGNGTNDWSDPGNWLGGVVPGTNDDAYIDGSCVSSATADISNEITVRSAVFINGGCLDTSSTFTAVNGVTFTRNAYLNSGTVIGTTAITNNSYINSGTVTGTTTFSNGAYNYGNLNGPEVNFTGGSNFYGGDVSVPMNFYDSYNQAYIGTDTHFYGASHNQGEVAGVADFWSSSQNDSILDTDGLFYDYAYNNASVAGNGSFFGDNSNNSGTVSGSLIRHYTTSALIERDFTSGGFWTIIADGAVIDVTPSTFNIHNTFQEINGGSFIGAGGFPGVTINSPTGGSSITTWSPSVAWHKTFNDYVTCQYSYNTVNWFGASCTGDGSDIIATTTYGTQTLTIRATDSLAVATTSAVTYNYTPARILYFYSSGADANWTTVGNWYTNSNHTIAAGAVPTSIDNVTVVGSTIPQVDLDTWTQPTNIYTQIGIAFTSATSASTTATTTGSATFNGSAKNKGVITGNVTFNGTSANISGGRIVGNATFNATTTNSGTVVLNATFYGDAGSNTGTISGVKTRYYNATTTTTRNFTGGWTVVADGVTVTVSSSTYDGTTKFKTLNNGYFIGGPTAVYWKSSIAGSLWTNTTNWYSDSSATVHLNRVASSTESVITIGSYAPTVDLDSGSWVAPTGIDASQTGITFTSASNAVLDTSVTGTTTFIGTVRNTSTILGDVIFASTTRNDTGAVISGNVTFNNTSINNGGIITGDATFNDSAVNGTSSASISGTAYFNGTSRNDGVISNDAYFYGDSTNNNGTVTGTKKRYYTANATTTRNFVTTAPWTLVADGAIVHLDDNAVFSATTTFTEINGGNFTGNSVPGSYTDCTKPLLIAATYTFQGNVTNACDIQTDGVTINGGGYQLGPPPPTPLPDNSSNSGWFDMTGNIFLYHMNDSSGSITDSSGNNRTGTVTGTLGYSASGNIGNAFTFSGDDYIVPASFPDITGAPFSGSLWFYHDSPLPSDVLIMGQHANGQTGWLIEDVAFTCGRHLIFQIATNNWYGTRSNCSNVTSGQWMHMAFTWDGVQTGRMYFNGQLVETATGMQNFQAAANNQFRIGAYMQTDVPRFVGKMDEVAMWSRKLSDAEVLNIYNNQSSGSGGALITTNNHNFNLVNLNLGGSAITSVGATINLTGVTTTVAFNVSGANAAGNAQNGGTITLTNSSTGALTANGGNSTDYGYGGSAGTITVGAGSSATSQTANAGSNGPNLGGGQSTGGGTVVSGCTDPNATNYNASATVYNGSCTYSNSAVRGCTNPSATNYNSNATVNDGSCSYPSYNTTPISNPNSGGSNSNSNNNTNNQNNNSNNTPTIAFSGFQLTPDMLGKLLLKNINGVGAPIINGVGITNFGNVLGGLQPLGNLKLSNISVDFVPQISAFLFAPLPNSIASQLLKSPKLLSLFASVGISREQDLVTIQRNPVLLPKGALPAGLFGITSSSTELDTYLAADEVHKLVEMIKVKPGQVITVSLEPLSKGKVLGLFLGDTLSFFDSGKAQQYVVIESPDKPGRYVLTSKSASLPLVINVEQPEAPKPVKKLNFVQKALKWISALFH